MTDRDSRPSPVHLLRAVTVELDLFAARFAAEQGLHGSDLRALISLLDAQRSGRSATPGWLGARLGLQSAAVTALVDRLAHRGLVQRHPDAADGRRVNLVVTASANELGWTFFGPLIEAIVDATNEFSSPELDVIERFLDATATAVRSVAVIAVGDPSPNQPTESSR